MKYSTLFIMLLLINVFAINSCTDDDNIEPVAKTNTEKLIGNNWLLVKATFNPPLVTTIGTQNLTFYSLFEIPLIDSCQTDNKIIFNADGTMTIDNGSLKCGTEPQTAKDGNWKFITNETQIEITNSAYFSLISADKVILDKVVLSETEMKGETDYIFINPITQIQTTSKIEFTFTK